jgi:putative spermidine/putrescine transport system ATP-binding protein
VTVLVRPEALRLVPAVAGGPAGPSATVVATSFLGANGRVQARLSDGTVVTAQMGSAEVSVLTVGEAVTVLLEPVPALAVPADRGASLS